MHQGGRLTIEGGNRGGGTRGEGEAKVGERRCSAPLEDLLIMTRALLLVPFIIDVFGSKNYERDRHISTIIVIGRR